MTVAGVYRALWSVRMSGETSLDSIFSGEQVEQTEVAETTKDLSTDEPQDQTGVDESVTPTDDKQEQDDPIERHKKGLEAGIAAERTKRQAAERELAELRAWRQQQEQQRKASEQPKTQEQEPQESDYATPQEYIRALARFEAKQLREAEKAEEAQAKAEREAQEQAQQMQRTADEVVTKGQQAFADFDTVINSGLGPYLAQETPQGQLFRQALLTGERAHEVAYFLAKNPGEAQRVYSLAPLQMVRAVSLIEATKLDALAATPEPTKPAIPKTLTQARDARGQFKPAAYDGPTPLDDVLATKR